MSNLNTSWWESTDTSSQTTPAALLAAPSAPPESRHSFEEISEEVSTFDTESINPPPYFQPNEARVSLKVKPKTDVIQLENLGFQDMETLADYINRAEPPFNELRLTDNEGHVYSLVAMFNPERPTRLALHKKPLYVTPGDDAAIATPITKAKSALWREQVASSFVDVGRYIKHKQVQTEGFEYRAVMTLIPSAPPESTHQPCFNSYRPAVSADHPVFVAPPQYNPAVASARALTV